MTYKDTKPSAVAELRRQAENILRGTSPVPEELAPEQLRQMLHELRVHQVELEMQNEELRRTQAELDAVRARYFDLYDLAPAGYCTVSEKGLILETNLAAAALLGVTRAALVGQPLTRFILAEDEDIYYRHRKQLFATGAPQMCELRMVKKDGTQCWVRLDATVAQDAAGAPVCRVVLSDITESKRAEEALRESDEQYRTLVEQVSDGIVIADATGRYLNANPAFFAMLGYSREELSGLRMRDVVAHDAQAQLAGHFDSVGAGTASLSEGRLVRKDGAMLPIEVSAKITPEGRRLAIVRDITARKRAEEALQKSEIHLQAIVESTADGILAVDTTGALVKANRRFAELWRIPPALMAGGDDRVLLEFVMSQLADPEGFLKKVQVLYASDAVDTDTLVFKDGRIFERVSMPMMMAGTVAGRVWSFRDITERKQAAAEQSRQIDELRRWQAVTLGRESRIGELKREVNALAARVGEKPPYGTQEQ